MEKRSHGEENEDWGGIWDIGSRESASSPGSPEDLSVKRPSRRLRERRTNSICDFSTSSKSARVADLERLRPRISPAREDRVWMAHEGT